MEKRGLRGDPINPDRYPQALSEDGARLCSVLLSNRARSNDQKLKHCEFHLDMR